MSEGTGPEIAPVGNPAEQEDANLQAQREFDDHQAATTGNPPEEGSNPNR